MPLLSDEQLAEDAAQRAGFRLKTAGTKLNQEEIAALERHCRDRGVTPGELIRQLILAELGRETQLNACSDPVLTEVLGMRLFLVNALRPLAVGQKLTPEAFDKLLDEISSAKHELAAKIVSERRR
jgi:Ribbon-helix-helix protein, copG family